MNRFTQPWGKAALLCGALLLPLSASAQERGRTDGPEGSEYGKGGYSRTSENRFALELNWGAALTRTVPLGGAPSGPPLFVGLTGSLWGADWYSLDLSGAYLFNGGRFEALLGPRFRTPGFPISLNAGLKAGAIFLPDVGLRFGISPQAGADVLLGNEHVLLGLGYAADIPIGGGGTAHRLFMNVGYRF